MPRRPQSPHAGRLAVGSIRWPPGATPQYPWRKRQVAHHVNTRGGGAERVVRACPGASTISQPSWRRRRPSLPPRAARRGPAGPVTSQLFARAPADAGRAPVNRPLAPRGPLALFPRAPCQPVAAGLPAAGMAWHGRGAGGGGRAGASAPRTADPTRPDPTLSRTHVSDAFVRAAQRRPAPVPWHMRGDWSVVMAIDSELAARSLPLSSLLHWTCESARTAGRWPATPIVRRRSVYGALDGCSGREREMLSLKIPRTYCVWCMTRGKNPIEISCVSIAWTV